MAKRKGWRNRITGHGEEAPDQLLANPANFRIHPQHQQDALAAVIERVGYVSPVIVNKRTGYVVDGHLRVAMAISAGEPSIPVTYVGLSPKEEALILTTLDPIAAMAGADKAQLESLLAGLAGEQDGVRALLDDMARDHGIVLGEPPEDPGAQMDRAEELQRKWGTERGQVWVAGQHRVMCGDSTCEADVAALCAGEALDAVVSDPPYCSGGFQEAGKASGSVGTRGDEMIHNDTLSTRGYIALMRQVLGIAPVGIVYVFTDWRMWINLFDVVESSGFGVRNMIVWDKGSPGMGAGWRMQHELILCGIRVKSPFDPKKAQGNVIQCQRTGNKLHATEKPVELIEALLDVTDMAHNIYDPFLGSGTTLVACEQLGRRGFGMEIEPKYVAVTLERLAGMGLTPTLTMS